MHDHERRAGYLPVRSFAIGIALAIAGDSVAATDSRTRCAAQDRAAHCNSETGG